MRRFFLLTLFLLANCGSDDEFGPASVQAAAPEAQGFTYLRKETFSCGGQTHTVPIYRHEKSGLEFVQVPGGEFTMGSPDGESGRHSDEGPQRRVQVKPFLLCRTEVPNGVYRKLRSGHDSGSYEGMSLNGNAQPVVNVSWEEASAWCKEMGLRLPSEAEWEYACRAGTTASRFWGDGESEGGRYANVADRTAKRKWPNWTIMETEDGHMVSASVGSFHPNAFGLFDMIGNVWEWCEGTWHNYDGDPNYGSAWLGGSSNRVIRGGSWSRYPGFCRSAFRGKGVSGIRIGILGFRPACSMPEPQATTQPASQPEVRTPASAPAPTSSPTSARYRPTVPGFIYLRHETFSCGGQTHSVAIYKHEKTGLEFVQVPGGDFTMGSPASEEGRFNDEGPLRLVNVKPFLLCMTEVTQAAWGQLMSSNLSEWKGPSLPVECWNWNDAQEWCRKAGLRLPTEAEWEYACRAGTTSRFCFGDGDGELSDYAWYSGNSGGQIHPVGQKRTNAFGLFDMHGNVCEWCEDNWLEDYFGSFIQGCRGGARDDSPGYCRSAFRGGDSDFRLSGLGFRPAHPSL